MVLVGKLVIAASAQLRVRRQSGEEEEEEESASDVMLVVVTIDGVKAYDTERGGIQGNRKIATNSNI